MTNIKYHDLEEGSKATPFSTFFWAGFKNDWTNAENQFSDDIEWILMPNYAIYKGKKDVVALCKAGKYASQKNPEPILNIITNEWGIWEYWNIGTVTEDVIEFANQSAWPFPKDTKSVIGKTYKVPVCFIYHINADNKIDLVREYLDVGSVMAQFTGGI